MATRRTDLHLDLIPADRLGDAVDPSAPDVVSSVYRAPESSA
ncbi:hypothetical protein ACPPVO_24585 [Dactylosporangium sp. McL0621]